MKFDVQSPGICLAVPGHFYGQSPAKSPTQIAAGISKVKSNVQELIRSDPISGPQNQKGNN